MKNTELSFKERLRQAAVPALKPDFQAKKDYLMLHGNMRYWTAEDQRKLEDQLKRAAL